MTTSNTPEFIPGRAQDASPTVRGFYYQINHTLKRWLELETDEHLVLECGEDIDRVISRDENDPQRVVEQVKTRGRNITIRSESARRSIANFVSHVEKNPELRLQFIFTTTASPGRERGTGLPGPGIAVWNHLRTTGTWTDADDNAALELAKLILNSSKPSRCTREAWTALRSVASGRHAISFTQLIKALEWSCGASEPDALRIEVLERIATLFSLATIDDPVCEQKYHQLIFTLLELLSQDGDKILTRESLQDALDRPTLTAADRARIDSLAAQLNKQSVDIESIKDAFVTSQLAGAVPASPLPSLLLPDSPPPSAILAYRRETVQTLDTDLHSYSWLNIYGGYGMGKSHLAHLIADRFDNVILRVTMRGMDEAEAHRNLLATMLMPDVTTRLTSTRSGLVVLDDLPDYQERGRLEAFLSLLASRLADTDHRILSTSRRSLPSSTTGTSGLSVATLEVPPFSDNEAEELFVAHGVDRPILTPSRVSSMNSACSGHPLLLVALARHLVSTKKPPAEALLDAILENAHRSELDTATARAVLDTVDSDNCRNLLYRLADIRAPLDAGEIRQIANVDPPLGETTLCVATLEGPWLRRTAQARFEVSPLTIPLGSDLPDSLRKRVHSNVSRLLLKRTPLQPSEFRQSIISMLVAGEVATAARTLVNACFGWPFKSSGYEALGVRLFFPLDSEYTLPPNVLLPLRAFQTVTAAIEGEKHAKYLDSVRSLIDESSVEAVVGALAAGSAIVMAAMDIPTEISAFGASLVERFHQHALLPHELKVDEWVSRYGHLLLPIARVHSWIDLDHYLDLLDALSPDRRQELADYPEFQEGAQLIIQKPMYDGSFSLLPDSFDRLESVRDRCLDMGLPQLAAHAATGRMVVLAEARGDFDGMLRESEASRSLLGDDPGLGAILDATAGQQLVAVERQEEGLSLLASSLDSAASLSRVTRVQVLQYAIRASMEIGKDPKDYTEALAIAIRAPEVSTPSLLCQSHALIAFSTWQTGDHEGAFRHLEQASLEFLEMEDGPYAKQYAAAISHAAGYYLGVVNPNMTVETTADGSPFTEPDPRMLFGSNAAMADFWDPDEGPAFQCWTLGTLAEALGLSESSFAWMDRALELALSKRSKTLLSVLGDHAVASQFRHKQWAEALEAAMIHGRALTYTAPDASDTTSAFDPFDVSPDPSKREKAERAALDTLGPILVAELSPSVYLEEGTAEDLSQVFHAFGETAELKTAWITLAKIIRLLPSDPLSGPEFSGIITEATESGGWVGLVAHGLLSLRADCHVGQAALSQAGVLRALGSRSQQLQIKYSQTVCDFWNSKLERAGFQFRGPEQLREAIASNALLPITRRARQTVLQISENLDVPLTDEVRSWLRDSE